jgi:Zn-dependent protease/CBS domain-containing protein
MFGKPIKLFNLLGFEVRIDLSWIIIAALVVWSLSIGLFPYHYTGLPARTYWLMGVAGALGLFFSIVFHEFSHSIIARRYGMSMKGITLFIFGGVAEMGEEPSSAKAEFMMAVVGPLSSVFIGLVFLGVSFLGPEWGWPNAVIGVVEYLAYMNGMLAGFNLLPAFPLDGGRMLRAILWGLKRNLRWATRISSGIGSGFGIFLILLGFFQFFKGNFVGGMWWFLIGMFLRNAARMSYQQLLIRKALEGEPVRRFMKADPVSVPPSTPLNQLVDDFVYKYHFKMFPVVEAPERLVGCVSTKQVSEIPREEWSRRTVREIATRCSPENTIEPQADAMEALSTMARTWASRLIVVEGDRVVGVVSLKDMLKFLSLKVELEG